MPQVVDHLTSGWKRDGPLDLSDVWVVVPTRQSGRRLREALASYAAASSTAVFPPRVLLPDGVISSIEEASNVASPTAALLAWVEVFQGVALDEFRDVFPVDPPQRDFGWALRIARQFTRLQHVLVESGLLLASVAERLGDTFPEIERWRQIARLEQQHAERLATRGFRDRHTIRIECARAVHARTLQFAEDSSQVSRIVVAGVPDPQPLAVSVLAGWSASIPIEVLVFAPEDEAAAFDEWGRPMDTVWSARELDLPDFESRVQVCADPNAQATRTAEVLRSYPLPDSVASVGVADADVLPALESALQHVGLVGFSPEGRKRNGDGLYQLVRALSALEADETFATVQALARCPDFLNFLRTKLGPRFSAAIFLRQLDRLHVRHLPPTLSEARRHAADTSALDLFVELQAELRSRKFPANAAAALSEIFGARKFDTKRPGDASTVEAAGAWTEVLTEVGAAVEAFPDLAPNDCWELALQMYAEAIHYEEKPVGAIELQGWLELLWEDAPHLMVCGFNDGRVPEAVVGDPFLPEGLRARLGLKTNATRFARDAYLLQAMATSRKQHGRLDLFLGKTSVAGDPLRPSRLLLRCTDAELPQRVEFLFKPAAAMNSAPAWSRAWQLRPRCIPAPATIAVTALRGWLACPFRFYLQRVLRMEAVDSEKTELDVFDFGTLCHSALEAMGRSPLIRDCVDAATIREFLLDTLEQNARDRYGAELTLPLIVQLESARQRLAHAADIQAATRAEGWVIQAVEAGFELTIEGLQIIGKIDRIDRNERTGAMRVLDYKTSDQPVDPWQAHLRGIRRTETPPEFACLTFNGREYVWSDLQLPMYVHALQTNPQIAGIESLGVTDAVASAGIVSAYFNLPKASSETGIRAWEGYTREIAEAAWNCAQGVSASIRAGVFWPPNENVRPDFDPLASLFHHGTAASVAWDESLALIAAKDQTPGNKGSPP